LRLYGGDNRVSRMISTTLWSRSDRGNTRFGEHGLFFTKQIFPMRLAESHFGHRRGEIVIEQSRIDSAFG
jgi:hypothetical protein